jgi:hypothetical protein
MLDRSNTLRQVSNIQYFAMDVMLTQRAQPITLFLQSADALYGPITVIRHNGHIEKKIPWSAFILADSDWERVKAARDILKVNLLRLQDKTITKLFH